MSKITVGFMRDLEKQLTAGDISYSRMVEIVNEQTANKTLDKRIAGIPKDGTHLLRWHVIHKCWVSVFCNETMSKSINALEWLCSTKSHSWPEEAFSDIYMMPPNPPAS